MGPHQVIAVGGPVQRLELARKWGATHTLDISELPDPAERLDAIKLLTNGRGADVVIEVSGVPSAFTEGIGIIRGGGRYLIVGQVHGQTLPFNPSAITTKHLQLIGTRGASIEHYYRGLEFLRHQKDRFNWDEMISGHYSLAAINDAFVAMKSWREIKPAIDFDNGKVPVAT